MLLSTYFNLIKKSLSLSSASFKSKNNKELPRLKFL